MEIGIEELLDRSLDLYDKLTSKETFHNVRTGCNDAYNEIRKKFAKMIRRLKHYNAKGLSDAERLAMYEKLKVYLEEIDFVGVLDNLS